MRQTIKESLILAMVTAFAIFALIMGLRALEIQLSTLPLMAAVAFVSMCCNLGLRWLGLLGAGRGTKR